MIRTTGLAGRRLKIGLTIGGDGSTVLALTPSVLVRSHGGYIGSFFNIEIIRRGLQRHPQQMLQIDTTHLLGGHTPPQAA